MVHVNEAEQVLVVERPDGTSEVTVGGAVQVLSAVPQAEVAEVVTALVAERAAALGKPVRVLTRSGSSWSAVVVDPSGAVRPDSRSTGRADRRTSPSPAGPDVETLPEAAPVSTATHQPDAAAATSSPPAGHRPWGYDYPEGRQSFLRDQQQELSAREGWRGALNHFGLRLAPDEAERSGRADAATVSQHWVGPRTIAVVNAKGGAGKTPTTAMLAATFARHGGAGVLAWENNQTRGTLGWRTEQARHDATSMDLLPRVQHLLGTGARAADLARYVHHQRADRYDVLRSQPLALASEQRVTLHDVDAVHELACKYYRMILIDSGNDESDPTWLRMVEHSDQLVVPTTTRDDHAEAGALLLEALAARDERSAQLAASAVVVVTQADPKATAADVQRVVEGFGALAHQVVTVPFDPALVDGQLRHDLLRPATQRAWLAAAAAVARGL